ncbi:rfrA family pentapeptide repeat [Crocosphaera subtropica ATCC 51142]|uniref:RfrA family pentapeptide repeat n=1 Tax=Crocosphaera subtropica (strain ATCC 51142 / BH68) TaxID=43989 RepID=B1X1Y6_CROS5|nr:pentapeptide repeat-containing protein [Crocosphaera subtropica]ACB54147.1 rfrA family pentapeptide repeat [Crocosphaera subtropica ATCC 51142]
MKSKINLKGKSFKGQNLSGTNFSQADIRGTNFTGANLTNCNFDEAIAGLSTIWVIIWLSLSSVFGMLAGFMATRFGFYLTSNDKIYTVVGLISSVVLFMVLLIAKLKNLKESLVINGAIWPISGTVIGLLSVVLQRKDIGQIDLLSANSSLLAVVVVVCVIIMLGITQAITEQWAIAVNTISSLVAAIIVAFIGQGEVGLTIRSAGVRGLAITIAFSVIIALACADLAKQILREEDSNSLIRLIAITLATTGGTNFRKANLTRASFRGAILKNTQFTKAKFTHTCWYGAKYLNYAIFGHSILENSVVRQLLITGEVNPLCSYQGLNLKGAYLTGADFKQADLTEADLCNGMLQGANLEGVNLTKVQALGTDFRETKLTGACGLETWNIDSNTRLEKIDCQFIYLLSGNRERRPNSGYFQPGEFPKLFQEVVDTVDLIFRKGVDWKAFLTAFNQLQIEQEGKTLEIRSIENKGDGFIVVKVNVSPDANKEQIHDSFVQNYELALKTIEEKYQAELRGRQGQIELYRQQLEYERQHYRKQNANLQKIIDLLANQPVNVSINLPQDEVAIASKESIGQLFILTINQGSLEQGFSPVIGQIWSQGRLLPTQHIGQLPPAPALKELYQDWLSVYQSLNDNFRTIQPLPSNTNGSWLSFTEAFEELLNKWLNSDEFRPIDKQLREVFSRSEEIRIIIQSHDYYIKSFPWHLWDFLKSYRQAEVAFNEPYFEQTNTKVSPRHLVRILAIFGNSEGLNLVEDRQVLENLSEQAIIEYLVEPSFFELSETLRHCEGWDIICFAGHSYSYEQGNRGIIQINSREKLTLEQLKHSLEFAIEKGLKLAIFNSCDGLGLARQMAKMSIPQVIVMRQPVPDRVAQVFIKNFLSAFFQKKSLYCSLREARESLQGLESEYPCASWLPIIYQNVSEIPFSLQSFKQ